MIYKSRALNFAFRKPEFDTIHNAYLNEMPFKYYTGCHTGTDIKFALNTRALKNLMSWERFHYFTETCTFMYNISENLIVKFQKCHWGKEN